MPKAFQRFSNPDNSSRRFAMVEDDQSAAHPEGRSSRGISSKENGCSEARHSQNSEESCCSALGVGTVAGCAEAKDKISSTAVYNSGDLRCIESPEFQLCNTDGLDCSSRRESLPPRGSGWIAASVRQTLSPMLNWK